MLREIMAALAAIVMCLFVSSASAQTVIKVEKGATLWKTAKSFNVSMNAILAANSGSKAIKKHKKDWWLMAGHKLTIPCNCAKATKAVKLNKAEAVKKLKAVVDKLEKAVDKMEQRIEKMAKTAYSKKTVSIQQEQPPEYELEYKTPDAYFTEQTKLIVMSWTDKKKYEQAKKLYFEEGNGYDKYLDSYKLPAYLDRVDRQKEFYRSITRVNAGQETWKDFQNKLYAWEPRLKKVCTLWPWLAGKCN